MSLSRSPENTQVRINAALDMIDQAADPLKVRFAVAYAIGYIDALHDERLISVDGAENGHPCRDGRALRWPFIFKPSGV